MRYYRIAKRTYISDMTGTGARIHGGRWNHKGASVIYVSESRALATTEYLVHVPISLLPDNLKLATIDVDPKASVETIAIDALPANWRTSPAPAILADMGNHWIDQQRSLIMRVPSVVVAGDFNALINPAHPEFKYVKLLSIVDYELDRRLLRMA